MVPELISKFEKEEGKGLVIIGVTDEKQELVDKWFREVKPNYPIVILKDSTFDKALDVKFFPTGAVIDPAGKLVYSGAAGGALTMSSKLLEKVKPGSLFPAKFAGVMLQVRARDYAKSYTEFKKVSADPKWTEKFKSFLEGEAASALADAKSAAADGRIYDAVQRITPFAKAATAFPTTKDSQDFLKSLQDDPNFKKEVSGGENYTKALALEDANQYSKCVSACVEVSKTFAGTKIAGTAKKHAEELISRGMPGYKPDCNDCYKNKKACAKHKEEMKV